MTAKVAKPLKPGIHPRPNTQAFWDAVNDGRFLYQHCADCGTAQFFPRTVCHNCHGGNLDWRESKGKGEVFTFSILDRAPSPAFKDDTPYTLALVDMEEGFRVTANVLNIDPEMVRIGMPVRIVYEDREGSDYKIPQVEPAL